MPPLLQVIVVIYVMLVLWLAIMSTTITIVLVEGSYEEHCQYWFQEKKKQCVNLSEFRIMWSDDSDDKKSYYICKKKKIAPFCKHNVAVYKWFVYALVACAFVPLGLLHHLMCLAANHAHHCNPICAPDELTRNRRSQRQRDAVAADRSAAAAAAAAGDPNYQQQPRRPVRDYAYETRPPAAAAASAGDERFIRETDYQAGRRPPPTAHGARLHHSPRIVRR